MSQDTRVHSGQGCHHSCLSLAAHNLWENMDRDIGTIITLWTPDRAKHSRKKSLGENNELDSKLYDDQRKDVNMIMIIKIWSNLEFKFNLFTAVSEQNKNVNSDLQLLQNYEFQISGRTNIYSFNKNMNSKYQGEQVCGRAFAAFRIPCHACIQQVIFLFCILRFVFVLEYLLPFYNPCPTTHIGIKLLSWCADFRKSANTE